MSDTNCTADESPKEPETVTVDANSLSPREYPSTIADSETTFSESANLENDNTCLDSSEKQSPQASVSEWSESRPCGEIDANLYKCCSRRSDEDETVINLKRCCSCTRKTTKKTDLDYGKHVIDVKVDKDLSKAERKKLWREIQKRKPFLTQRLLDHIKKYGKPPFAVWNGIGCGAPLEDPRYL